MENVVIIGSGPAGLTAAIYAARANLKPLCIEGVVAGGPTGGQLMITTEVENYPGFPAGVKGPELVELFRKQAERFGTRFITADVDRVHLTQGRPFKLDVEGKVIETESVILATGASARWLGLESEAALMNRGVSACATCDGYFFRDQDVCVVGAGDTALEEGLYLAGLCKSVTIIHRRKEMRASKIMQERAMKHPKISFMWDSAVVEVLDVTKDTVSALRIKNLLTGEEKIHPTQGLFIAIGHTPNSQLVKGQIDLDENGYVHTQPGRTATNIDGVFACGDLQDHVYRQAITAAGTGCMAAIEAERYLGSQGVL